jgi:predicted DNA-binding transcriptional regulator YafY
MRADRLISLIMLLQTRERITATELSGELEVSTRTIYRDIVALNSAGVPIYTDRGPGGGVALLESYRTSLTGMNEDEARALFMLSIPDALVELGVDQKLKSALLKLSVALPRWQQAMQTPTQQRIYLDSTSWSEPARPSAQLGVLHQAVWQDKLVKMVYHGTFDTKVEFELEPMGLVAKMNEWYLVGKYRGYIRVFNVADIMNVEILDRGYTRDTNFDLAAYWTGWCAAYQARRPVYPTVLRIAPTLLSKLHLYLGEEIKYTVLDNGLDDEQEWSVVSIQYANFFQARQSILNFGNAAEVLEPDALRISLIDFAQQIVEFYGN